MSERGVFAVDRAIWDHDFLADSAPFSRREAWLWLVSEAAWKPHRRRIAGKTFELSRGQIAASLRFIASKWRWSEARVRRFLICLKTEGMVDAKTDAGMTVLTICNYDSYQRVSLPSDAKTESEPDAAATQQRRKVEGKEDKEYSVANATAAPAQPRTPSKVVFDEGLQWLRSFQVSEHNARALLGKWRKAVGDARLIEILSSAQREEVLEPVAWIEGAIRSGVNGTRMQNGTASKDVKREEWAAVQQRAGEFARGIRQDT